MMAALKEEPPSLSLDLQIDIDSEGWDELLLRLGHAPEAVMQACLRQIDAPHREYEAGLLLTDDQSIARLNGEFRQKPKPTNVLSFPAMEWEEGRLLEEGFPAGAPLPLGDIVLARETILHEAEAQGKPVEAHLMHLLVHGILHLCGYDHMQEEQAARMEALEAQLLAAFGLSDPYQERRQG